jgi:alpha-L-fucosidase
MSGQEQMNTTWNPTDARHAALTRREFLAGATGGLALAHPRLRRVLQPGWLRPTPSPSQLLWQRDELALFLHFGVNTFSDREWGDGKEDPASFAPGALDARQWARSARSAGFRTVILTAKHHDGFCLWPTTTTTHSVAASPWRGGKGDVVREFVDAGSAERLRIGLYCSPWDRNAPVYGDSPRYNDLYCEQLTELLTGYGPIHEFWFDGANGEGPNGRRQAYDWPRFFGLVHRLQPGAVIFSDAGPDIRWIGNEHGEAGDPNWSTVDPALVPYPGADGEGVIEALLHGNPDGPVWRPGETDTSIRPGWFYHPAEDDQVRTVEQLVQLYFTSVGRNSKLLLNVPPTREGLLHATDVGRLGGMHAALSSLFEEDLAAGKQVAWRSTGPRSAIGELDLGRSVSLGIVDLREQIEQGQLVARYSVEGNDGGEWRPLAQGTTIGCRKLDRCTPTAVRRLRLRVDEAVDTPRPVSIGLYPGV